MRAALYCRVSTDSQRKKDTIETQKLLLADYADRQGWEILDWYIDDGITGTSIEDRPAFTKLLSDAEARKFDLIAVTDTDRLTRSDDPRQRALIEYILKENGIKVAVANTGELLDLDNPMHELIHSFKSWMAKEDRKKLLQRTLQGKKTKILQGKHLFKPPYGYRKSEVGTLLIEEAEAKTIRHLFSCYLTGKSMYHAAQELNAEGLYRRAGIRWTAGQISALLKNTLYKGEFRCKWGSFAVPPIVDVQTWQAARQQAESNTSFAKRRTKHDYLVRGLMYCGCCGFKMIAKTNYPKGKPYSYYRCLRNNRTSVCPMPTVGAKKADAVVWELIENLITEPDVLSRVLSAEQSDKHSEPAIRTELERLDRKLKAKHHEKSQILRLYRRQLISEADLEEQLQEIKTAEEMFLATRALEEGKLASFHIEKRKIQDLESALGRLRKDIDKFSFEQKRELLRLIVPGDKVHRIIANPDKSLDVNGVIDFKRLSEPVLQPTGTDYSGFGLSRSP